MTAKRFTVDGDGKYWDTVSNKYVTIDHLFYLVEKLEKENGQLKSTIKDVVELLSEEVDLFSDKVLEHDIYAYKELMELDNKDAYYMATSTKKAIKMLKEVKE